jgi:hypothetical protein
MRFAAAPISDLCLQRFHRWAILWLCRFVGFLDAVTASGPLLQQAHAIAHTWLNRIERLLADIILIRAGSRLRPIPPPRGVAQHARRDHGLLRAALGGTLRRALRSRDLRARVAALRQDITPLVARIVRRAPRGLTRRRPILPTWARRDAPAATACGISSVDADTS